MSDKTDMGGQAFPRAGFSGPGGFGKPADGMTLWDRFAERAPVQKVGSDVCGCIQTPGTAAREAAEYADAMLAERTKRTGGN